MYSLLSLVSLLAVEAQAAYPYNKLAKTPQMGWDNWNAFGCEVSEDLLLGTAKKMVSLGLRDAGYHYVVLDDCWSLHQRNETGHLQADPKKFPKGMAWVADQLHSMNLGFGMYSSAGTYTCARYPGSLGYEEKDAKTFASWGVDYLKYDNCYNEGESGTPLITYKRYKKMSDALLDSGRDILYSMCNWGEDWPWKWAQTMANSWRMSGDIEDSFDRADPKCPCTDNAGMLCGLAGFHCSVMNILNKVASYTDKAIPHAWNDLDGLEVGNGGMTDEEYKMHFTMWAAVKSPLIMGNDIRTVDAKSLSILTNPAVLALSQDALGSSVAQRWRYAVANKDRQGFGEIQMWSGGLDGGDYMAILINAGDEERLMNATLTDIFIESPDYATEDWDMYDVWANRMSNEMAGEIVKKQSTQGIKGIANYWWNNTAMSYAEGLRNNEPVLMGKMVGTAKASSHIKALVPKHGVMAYRMRPSKGNKVRSEL